MSKFSHLKKLGVKSDVTAEYAIHQIIVNGEMPTLTLAPATEANSPYFNSLLRRASKASKRIKNGVIKKETIDENREEDRKDFAKHVIKGWKGVTDEKGVAVEFDADSCLEFLEALPNEIFDEIRAFATDASNFSEVLEINSIAKN